MQTGFQRTSQTSGKCHLQSIENPGDTKCGHHQRVETAPRQSVKPRGDVRFDNLLVLHHERNVNAAGLVNSREGSNVLRAPTFRKNRPNTK